MNRDINCDTDSAPNLCVKEKSLSTLGSITEKVLYTASPKDLLNKELNKNITKLCSEADMRIKVLLSNTGASTSSSKLSSLTFDSTSKPSSHIILPPIAKKVSNNFSKQSSLKKTTSKQKSSGELVSSSHHFNTEIDISEEPTSKQQTVIKIIRLRNLARKMEERQMAVIKNKFESSVYQKSYTNGLEEGFRYGYFVNLNEKLYNKSEFTKKSEDSTYDDFDKTVFRSTDMQSIENKDSDTERMRGGYQDPQKSQKKKQDPNISSATNKSEFTMELSTSMEEKPSKLTIIHEYPNKCTEEINVQEFNEKFAIGNKDIDNFDTPKASVKIGLSTKTLTDIDRGGQYLQYFEKMLKSVGNGFAKGFRAGFGDGFVAANVFIPTDTTFNEDEKEYIGQLRKILKFSDDDLKNDIKKIYARADQMRTNLNISPEDFEEINYLIEKGLIKKHDLEFSKNDYKYYKFANKKDKKKIKSMYEADSEIIFSSYEAETEYVPQHTKNRALNYITKHKINEFFQFLGSHLIASKPDDPISFLIGILDKCIEYRFNEYVMQAPLLFTKKHVESVYYVLDPMLTGYINLGQYVHGMEALGIKDMGDLSYFRPNEKIDKYIFITNACRRLLCAFREMIAMDSITGFPSKAAYTTVEAK